MNEPQPFDYLYLCIAVASPLVGFVAAVFMPLLQARVVRPKLELLHDIKHIGVGTGDIVLTPETPAGNYLQSVYFRVGVKNMSRVTAKACRAYLAKIERFNRLGVSVVLHDDLIPLVWAFRDEKPEDLPPGMRLNFDVCKAVRGTDFIHPQTVQLGKTWESSLSEDGEYVFTVIVASDNGKNCEKDIRVRWDGDSATLIDDLDEKRKGKV